MLFSVHPHCTARTGHLDNRRTFASLYGNRRQPRSSGPHSLAGGGFTVVLLSPHFFVFRGRSGVRAQFFPILKLDAEFVRVSPTFDPNFLSRHFFFSTKNKTFWSPPGYCKASPPPPSLIPPPKYPPWPWLVPLPLFSGVCSESGDMVRFPV